MGRPDAWPSVGGTNTARVQNYCLLPEMRRHLLSLGKRRFSGILRDAGEQPALW